MRPETQRVVDDIADTLNKHLRLYAWTEAEADAFWDALDDRINDAFWELKTVSEERKAS